MITNKFYKKEKLLENEKDLANEKLSSKSAVQKSLTQNWQNIPRSSWQNDKSKTAKASPKVEMEANKKKNAKKENIWTADANSDVSDSQLNDSNDSDETQIVYK